MMVNNIFVEQHFSDFKFDLITDSILDIYNMEKHRKRK